MSTAEIFDKLWRRYDEWYIRNTITAENEVRVLKSIGLSGRGLEIGVGTGYFASRLKVEYGIDPSINMVKVAKSRGIEVVASLGEYLPFRDSTFDFILMVVTLCFVDEPSTVLMEAYRVLRAGGLLTTCIIPRDSVWGQYYINKKDSPFYRVARFYTLSEVKAMIKNMKFKILRYIATLTTYGPEDTPKYEEPVIGSSRGGFVCIVAKKNEEQEHF